MASHHHASIKQPMNWNIEQAAKAWKLASSCHDGQKYGGAKEGEHVEYLNHIGSVAFEIINALQYEEDIDADLVILCAILHDTVEDTALSKDDIRAMFGEEVAAGVSALSKNGDLESKEEMMQDSLDRIVQRPREVAMVKMADRISNLSCPPYYWDDDKKLKYLAEATTIHARLAYASAYLSARLESKIKDYERFIGCAGSGKP